MSRSQSWTHSSAALSLPNHVVDRILDRSIDGLFNGCITTREYPDEDVSSLKQLAWWVRAEVDLGLSEALGIKQYADAADAASEVFLSALASLNIGQLDHKSFVRSSSRIRHTFHQRS